MRPSGERNGAISVGGPLAGVNTQWVRQDSSTVQCHKTGRGCRRVKARAWKGQRAVKGERAPSEKVCALHAPAASVTKMATHPKAPSVMRAISLLGRGTPKHLVEDIFFFNSWKHSSSSSLVVHLPGGGGYFFIRWVKGTDRYVELWIWAKTTVHVVADIQNVAMYERCSLGCHTVSMPCLRQEGTSSFLSGTPCFADP